MTTPGDDDRTVIVRCANDDGCDGPLTMSEKEAAVTLVCSILFVLFLLRLDLHVCCVCVCCECCMSVSLFRITQQHTPKHSPAEWHHNIISARMTASIRRQDLVLTVLGVGTMS